MGQGRDGAMQEATRHLKNTDSSGETLKDWDAADLVDRSDDVGKELKDRGMTTSQIRNFLDEVNRIDAETKGRESSFDPSSVILLKPQLAYVAGRETDRRMRPILTSFAELFSAAADKVQEADDFRKFAQFTRAVVAYHRFHGGKE